MTKPYDITNVSSDLVPTSLKVYYPSPVNRTIESKLGDTVSVKDFGAVGDGTTDDTAAIQAAIDACRINKQILYFPSGTYLVTNTLNILPGVQLKGETEYQYVNGFGVAPKATTIKFSPTSQKNLFNVVTDTSGRPAFHISIQSFYIEGNSTNSSGNSDIALKLDGVVYANFANIGITGFRTAIYCTATINNRFENIYASGTVQAVWYGGIATTDVWDQCSFWGSPVGITMAEATVGIRFNSCLFEQLDNYGMDICRETQGCMMSDAYSEDVPYTTAASDAAMFRVGYLGSSLTISQHLKIIGGFFSGRNAGIYGSFLDINYSNGVYASGFDVNRFTWVIRTNVTNTRNNSVVLSGYNGVSWTNAIENLSTKVAGIYPIGVINSGTNSQNGIFNSLTTTNGTACGWVETNLVVPPNTYFAPSTDNNKTLGLSNLRWSVVYAGTGTINTSDGRSKQQLRSLYDAEKAAALKVKGLLKAFKFTDAVESKGDKARIHFGVVAQELVAAFASEGLDARDYGLLCYDNWKAELDEDGNEITPAGDRYGVRYEELLAFIISAI